MIKILNIPIKLATFTIIYFLVLIIISPIIDHFFTTLEEDKAIKENNFQILMEIILQLIVVIIIWYFLHGFLSKIIKKYLKITMGVAGKAGVDLVTAITLVGLQKNLIEKLEYITIEHPFRISDFLSE